MEHISLHLWSRGGKRDWVNKLQGAVIRYKKCPTIRYVKIPL